MSLIGGIVNIFSPKGRVSRKSYALIMIPISIYFIFCEYFFYTSSLILLILFVILSLLSAYIGIVSTIKRLHDLNRPGEDFFYRLLPIYNFYFEFQLLFNRGTIGANFYGYDNLKLKCPSCLRNSNKEFRAGKFKCSNCNSKIHVNEKLEIEKVFK